MCPKEPNIFNVAQKHGHQYLFCYMKKQTKNQETFNTEIPPHEGIKLQMFYMNLPHNSLQIFVSVLIENRRIARPLFTCFY